MRKLLVLTAGYLVAALLLMYTTAAPTSAQLIQIAGLNLSEVDFYSDAKQDDTTAAGLAGAVFAVKYIGTEESGTLDLNANAIEFFSGPLGSEVINGSSGFDVNTGDVCGTTNDSLDVTDAQCDTPAELCMVVNSSGAPWVCILLHSTGAASLATAAEYEDMADAQAKLPGGFGVEVDDSDTDDMSLLMIPTVGKSVQSASGFGLAPFGLGSSGRNNIEFFLTNVTAVASYDQDIKLNPYSGTRAVLTGVNALVDSTSGWTLNIYAVRYGRAATPTGAASPGALGTRLYERLVFTADGTDATVLTPAGITGATPLVSGNGETFLIQVTDDALVTATIAASGYFIPAK